jgi:1-acyl-sn-glycerol-3-phosphate acyltransferase
MVKQILQPLYAAWVVLTFFAGLVITLPAFLVLSFGNRLSTRKIIFAILNYWFHIWLWIIGMRVSVSGPAPPPGRYVAIANHISYLDTIALFPALPGYFRPLGKKEFSKVPVLGFIYKQIVVMVNRGSAESRAKSMRLLWHILRHESDIIIFPEGTFNETGDVLKSFYDGAFKLAITTQTPIFPVVFPDTVHRWHYSAWWKVWPGRNRAIRLAPIEVAGMTMADLPALKEQARNIMRKELEKYDYP